MDQPKNSKRPLSDAERLRILELRAQIDSDKQEIIAQGRQHKANHDAVAARIREMIKRIQRPPGP